MSGSQSEATQLLRGFYCNVKKADISLFTIDPFAGAISIMLGQWLLNSYAILANELTKRCGSIDFCFFLSEALIWSSPTGKVKGNVWVPIVFHSNA